jgi:hypothetical protein
MARGVPVVVTGLSELGRASAAAGAALPYRAGDAGSLAAAIGALADDAALAARTARAALDWLRTERSVAATTAPLVAWARAPRPAADRAAGGAARLAARHAEMLRDIAHLEGR